MVEVIAGLLHALFEVGQLLVGFLDIESRNLADGFLAQLLHILSRHFTPQQLAILVETAFNARVEFVPIGIFFVLQFLIDTLFEEYLLQRHPVPTVFQLIDQNP